MKEQKYCTMCGQVYEVGDKFCQGCGVKLEVPEIAVPAQKNSFGGKKLIAVVAAVVLLVAGSVTGYAMIAKNHSADSVIRKTLALESGKISLSYDLGAGLFNVDDEIRIDFLKNKNEKTFLFESQYEEIYVSAKDGKVRAVNSWGEEEYDFEDELGLDASKLEKDLIDFLANSFKGKSLPKEYLENVRTEKIDGKVVITGDITDEVELLEWIYDSYDMRQLRDLILNNLSKDSSARDDFKDEWQYAIDEMDQEVAYLFDELNDDDYGIDTSFKIVIDKKGILEQANLIIDFEHLNYNYSNEMNIKLRVSDKNELQRIKEPKFN